MSSPFARFVTRITLAALMALAVVSAPPPATAAATTPWRWEQSFTVDRPGMVRVVLPPGTLDALQPGLHDARLVSPEGVETPWLVEAVARPHARQQEARNFQARLDSKSTVLTADTGTTESIEAVTLVSPARGFLKSVRIEARMASGDWRTLESGAVAFRQADGIAHLRIPVETGVYEAVRVTIDDERTEPVPFTGLRLELTAVAPSLVAHPAHIVGRTELPGRTRIELDLGAVHLDVARIEIETGDALFSRACSVTASVDGSANDPVGAAELPIATGAIFRVAGEHGATASNLALQIGATTPGRRIFLTIDNGNSPPLDVRSIRAFRHPTALLFFAPMAGSWKLLSGNPHAPERRYDVSALRARLGGVDAASVQPGPLQPRADFSPDPVLPGIPAIGAALTVADWRYERTVTPPGPGVVRVELDAAALAHARRDMGDVRLMQAGHQIPYLIDKSRPLSLAAEIVAEHDPERPTLSRWRVTLPVDGFPAARLTARSMAPLFVRSFSVRVPRTDELGNEWMETVGQADWRRAPGDGSAELNLPLRGAPLPSTFLLETDNGANNAIAVDQVRAHADAPVLVAKLDTADPVMLLYGNPGASGPRYDLSLVRAELLRADAQAAVLGPEIATRPDTARARRAHQAGSPWLWVAMAIVTLVLLAVIARLLPAPARPPEPPERPGGDG